MSSRPTAPFILTGSLALLLACSSSDENPGGPGGQGGSGGAATANGGSGGSVETGGNGGAGAGFNPGNGGSGAGVQPAPQFAELWYSVDDRLVHIPLTGDGAVASVNQSVIENPPPLGQNLLTMMKDGSLIGGRHDATDDSTHFYYLGAPPRDGSDVTFIELGVMIDNLVLEALYTDCDDRLYGMDTGPHASSAEGNRLLRFTGDFLAGDFTYEVVSDLSMADVADIDDMSPGIDADGNITDNPGLAIDTGTVHDFNYESGSGTPAGMGGTYGIHAVGGALFDDDKSRLYVFNIDAELFEMDPVTFMLSPVLTTGPTDVEGSLGHSGLTGPLTDCITGFTPPD